MVQAWNDGSNPYDESDAAKHNIYFDPMMMKGVNRRQIPIVREATMKYIDMDSWPRRKHFEIFNSFDYPHFNVCADVDVTEFKPTLEGISVSFTLGLTYVLAHAANSIPEFRHRIREGRVIEHEIVHPSITILLEDETFSFCTINFTYDFSKFIEHAQKAVARVKENPTIEDKVGQDDLLFMTSIPWISFTGFMHPIHMHPVDSVPRIAWGKIAQKDSSLHMPLSVQGHHALMDGLHAGRYFSQVQEMLNHPETFEEFRKPA